MIFLNIRPFSKERPRVTRRGTFMTGKYSERKKLLTALYLASRYRNIDFKGKPIHLKLIFCFKVPKSWTKKMKSAPDHRRIVHDIDNLSGGVMDALNGIAWNDDKDIVSLTAEKRYCEEDGISIQIKEKIWDKE